MNRICLTTLLLLSVGAERALATDIPVNIGAGPAAFHIPERLDEEDPEPFYGLRLHIKAVIDREVIKRHKNKIPPNLRSAVEKLDEVRVGYLLIPESIMIGTRKSAHGPEVYGATWRPLGMGLPLKAGPVTLSLGTGLLITYAFVNIGDYALFDKAEEGKTPERREQVTHFFRPGADAALDLEIKLSDAFLTSLGWSSAYYVPQKIGGGIGSTGFDDLEKSLWRIHQAYFMLHYRIPVEVRL